MKLSLIIPAFNEEASIERFFSRLNSLEFDSNFLEIIFVNDGSNDKTKILLEENIKNLKFSNKIINHKKNQGYGASLKTGLRNSNNDTIAICDIDLTYPIEDLKKLHDLYSNGNLDMIVGERVFEKNSDNFYKKIGRSIIRKLIKLVVNDKITDFNSGLRIFNKKIVMENLNFYPNKFSFTTTSTILMTMGNKNIQYLPIKYSVREGQSKIKVFDFFRFLKLVFYIVFNFKPFKVLLPLNILITFCMTISVIIDMLNLDITDTTVILIFLSINVFLLSYLIELMQRIIRKIK